jgi:high-affinity nickel-transport protein
MDLATITDWTSLCMLVLVLGMRHGFDADHLATIDGLTRYNARHSPALARYCGTLFSLGHGTVVITIAVTVSLASAAWQVPQWLDAFGTVISIAFLLLLGLINLHAVFAAPPDVVVRPVGIKGQLFGRLFQRISQTSSPLPIAAVGALFAFSFDTLSQAALFAVVATHFGGLWPALQLGLIFMLGMLIVDGANGYWISHLLRRSDELALIASRVMGLVVAGISLMVATFAIVRWTLPVVEIWSEGKELYLGIGIMGLLGCSYWLASITTPANPRNV